MGYKLVRETRTQQAAYLPKQQPHDTAPVNASIGGDFTPVKDIQLKGLGWVRKSDQWFSNTPREIGLWNANGTLLARAFITDTQTMDEPASSHDLSTYASFLTLVTLKQGVTYTIGMTIQSGDKGTPANVRAWDEPTMANYITLGHYRYTNGSTLVKPTTDGGVNWWGDIAWVFDETTYTTLEEPPDPIVSAMARQFVITLPKEFRTNVGEWDIQYSTADDNVTFGEWFDLTTVEEGEISYTHTDLDLEPPLPYYRYRYRLRLKDNKQTDWSEAGYGGPARNAVIPSEDFDVPIGGDPEAGGVATSREIATGSLISQYLYAGTAQINRIQASNIATGAITADHLDVTSIDAIIANIDELISITITGALIRTNAGTGNAARIELTNTTLKAYDGSSATVTLDGAAGALTALKGTIGVASITATQLYVGNSATTQRVALDASGFRGFNSSNQQVVGVSPTDGKLVIGDTAARRLEGDRTSLRFYTTASPSTPVVTLDDSGLTATAGTITGGTFQTGLPGTSRIELTSSRLRHVTSANVTGNFELTSAGALTLAGSITALAGSVLDGVYLSNGTVTAAKVKANDIEANRLSVTQIQTITLQAGNVLIGSTISGAIQAEAIQTGHLSATAVDGMLITGTTIRTAVNVGTGTPPSVIPGIIMTPTYLRGYSNLGAQFDLNATTGALSLTGVVTSLPGSALPANIVGPGELADDSVNQNKVLDRSLQGYNLAFSSITAEQLAISRPGVVVDLTNPTFEHATAFTGWTQVGGTWSNASDFVKFGAKSAKIVHGSAATSYIYQDITLPIGDWIVASWVKWSGITSGTVAVNVDTGTGAGTIVDATGTGTTADWTYLPTKVTVTTAGTFRVHLHLGYGSTTTGTAWFDSVSVFEQVKSTIIKDGAISSANITASEWIEAKQFRSGSGSTRWEMDTTGLRFYNAGSNIFNYNASTGALSLTGSITVTGGVVGGLTDLGTITSGIIQGATIKTNSAGNDRLEMTSSGLKKILADNTTVPVQIGVTNGLDLLAGISSSPPSDRHIRWLNSSGNVLTDAYTYDLGTSMYSVIESGLYGDPKSRIEWTANAHTGAPGFGLEYSDVRLVSEGAPSVSLIVSSSELGGSSIVGQIAGGDTALVLDASGNSSFLKLDTDGNRNISFGSGTTSISAATSKAWTVTHGLSPLTPIVALVSIENGQFTIAVGNYTSSQFTVTIDSTAGSRTINPINYHWVAIG